MNDIEKSHQEASLSKYERLLLERDSLKKEADCCLAAYIRKFGAQINRVFQIKIDCISKKKSIAFCQAAVNRGEMVNAAELQKHLEAAMAEYRKQLEQMTEDYKNAKELKISSAYDCVQSKSLYRRIARLIHPDINPAVWKYPGITDLWERTTIAYGMNDVLELQTVELLVHKILDENGFHPGSIQIDHLEKRVEQLEKENLQIITTDPYLYKNLLSDAEASAQKEKELEEEYDLYAAYSKELGDILKEYLKKGMTVEWEQN